MVAVPAGDFMMGAAADEVVTAKPEDQVRVSIVKPFAVGRFAVTRGEFAAFVAAPVEDGGVCHRLGEHGKSPQRDWRSPGYAQDDRHPVVCVSWHDAKAYVAWLSSTSGKRYRLLSEAEREFVTRAGSITRSGGATRFRPVKPTTMDALPMPAARRRVAQCNSCGGQLSAQPLGSSQRARQCLGLDGGLLERKERRQSGRRQRKVKRRLQLARCERCVLQQLATHTARGKARAGTGRYSHREFWISCRQGFLIGAIRFSQMKRPAQLVRAFLREETRYPALRKCSRTTRRGSPTA